MTDNTKGKTFVSKIRDFLGSIKLTVIVLLTLAATSILGTLIPQNADPAWYFQKYGEILFRLFTVFQIFDMYHSWWFQFLIITLGVNIIVCSLDRFGPTWKMVFPKKPKFNVRRFREHPDAVSYEIPGSGDLTEPYRKWIAGRFGYHRMETSDGGVCFCAEKGRWTRFGVYFVHTGVVLLLIGAMIGMIWGFDGFVNIPEGEAVDAVALRGSETPQPLAFQIKCNDFDVSFYDNGSPKEFRSALSIIENGAVVEKKDIIVNDPLRYKGINVFQSSYGKLPPEEVTATFTDIRDGKSFSKDMRLHEPVRLPDGLGTFVIEAYKDNLAYKGHHLHDAFIGTWTTAAGEKMEVVMPYPFPMFDASDPAAARRMQAFQMSAKRQTGVVPETIKLSFMSNNSGMTYQRTLSLGEPVVLPEDLGLFVISEISESYAFKGHPVGEALIGTLTHKDGKIEEVVLPVRFPMFDKMRKGAVVISVTDMSGSDSDPGAGFDRIVAVTAVKERYYTGLQVTKDPGVWVVYAGFLAMIIGCYITFFMSHKRVFIEITKAGSKQKVLVSGTANKNPLGMRKYIKTLSRRLQKVAGGRDMR